MHPATITAKKALSCTTLSEANPDSESIFERGPTITDATAQVTLKLKEEVNDLAQTGFLLLYGKSQPIIVSYLSVKKTWTGRWQFVVSFSGEYSHELTDLVNHMLYGQQHAVVFPMIEEVDLTYASQKEALLRLAECIYPQLQHFVERHVLPCWLFHHPDSPTLNVEKVDRAVAYQFPIAVNDAKSTHIPLLGIARKTVAEVVPLEKTETGLDDAAYFLFSAPIEMPHQRWPIQSKESPFELVENLPEGFEKYEVKLTKAPSLPNPSDVSGVLFNLEDPKLIADYEAFFDVYQVWLTGYVYNHPLQIGGYAHPLQDSVYREAKGYLGDTRVATSDRLGTNLRSILSGLTDPTSKASVSIGTAIAYVLAPQQESGEVEWVLAQAVFQNT